MKKIVSSRRGYLVTTARATIVSAYGLKIEDPVACQQQVMELLKGDRFAYKEIENV
jgi:hypothetical protein